MVGAMNTAGIVACFGEVLLRYSPTHDRALRNATGLDVFPGGAEANVAAGLSNIGRATRMISALPANELGAIARRALQREGVDTTSIVESAGRMGICYVTPAGPMRQSSVIYDRANTSFALLDRFDFGEAIKGVQHLHVSGISLAVSAASRTNTLRLAQTAKDSGLTISFDGNFRQSLWKSQSTDPRPHIANLVGLANLFFGNHRDMTLLLDREFSGDEPDLRREAALAGLEAFPNLAAIASTARDVDERDTHRIVARIDTPETAHQTQERVFSNVADRIGTGDAFAAGVIDGWLKDPSNLEAALEQGMTLTALKHFSRGDFSLATRAELSAAMKGKGDVLR